MTPPVLVWFRQDLRLTDHEPLAIAARSGAPVACVYCLDPRDLAEQQGGGIPPGLPKTGGHRLRFLLESLADLRASLRAIGGELVVRRGRPEDVLPTLAQSLGATRVLAHAEMAPEEAAVERAVRAAIEPVGAQLALSHGRTLVHPDDLPFAPADLPDVFTKFRFKIEPLFEDGAAPRMPLDAPERLTAPEIDAGEIPDFAALGVTEPPRDARENWQITGGERAAHERLEHWVWQRDCLRRYKTTRNGLLHPNDASRFSPWLALGCLSPRVIYAAVRLYERDRVRNEDTHWLIVELLWRDYFRFVLRKHGAALFAAGGLQDLTLPWGDPARDADARTAFERWTRGETGYPLVDAAMQELAATGFTTNRARQNVASFLTKNLGVDWRAGAAWFETQLVDYDVASNWGNWAYAAGVGNDARGFRFFNIHKQSRDYDANGAFVKHWLPALRHVPAPAVHQPERLSAPEQEQYGVTIGRDYPAPIVDLFKSATAQERKYMKATGGAPSSGPRGEHNRRRRGGGGGGGGGGGRGR